MKPNRPLAWLGLAAAIAMRAAEPSLGSEEQPSLAAKPVAMQPLAKTLEPGVDLREVDKPRNTIFRLPDFVATDQKVRRTRPIREIDLMTPRAKIEAMHQKHPGLRVSLPFLSNDGIALAMYEEEQQLARKRQTYDLVSLLPAGPQAKKARAIADEAFSRADFGPSH